MKQTYLCFRYLKAGRDTANEKNCVELGYTKTKTSFIVRDEATNDYKCFETYPEFKEWFDKPNSSRMLHEVIDGARAQKLKFDIDVSADSLATKPDIEIPPSLPPPVRENTLADEFGLGELDEICYQDRLREYEQREAFIAEFSNKTPAERKALKLFNRLMEQIMKTFNETYIRELRPSDFAIADSSNGTKYSRHVVIKGFAVENNREAAEFTRRVVDDLPDEISDALDLGVNKATQNFRLPNCHKKGDSSRIMRITSAATSFEDMVVGLTTDCMILPRLIEPKTEIHPQVQAAIDNDIERYVVECAAPYTIGMTYTGRRDNMFLYRRDLPSHCEICKRVHDSDNTGFVIVANMNIRFYCRHAPSENRLHIGSVKQFYDQERPRPDYQPMVVEPPKEFKTTEYSEQECRPIDTALPTQIIRAGMGSGKTNALAAAIETLPEDMRVVMVSFRRSFTTEMAQRFNGFADYRECDGEITATRVIVQFESLHRLRLEKDDNYMLVLDESESILSQIGGGANNPNLRENWSKLQWLNKYSKNIIAMDAMAGPRTFNLLARANRAGEIYMQYNKWTPAPEDAAVDLHYDDYNKWRESVLDAAKTAAETPIVICASSKSQTDTLARVIAEDNPALKIDYYNSDSGADKRADLQDVNTAWSNTDVLIYTPSISAGISFVGKRFSRVYAYFSNRSCDWISSIQMLGRVRNVAEKTYHIYIQSTACGAPETEEQLDEAMAQGDDILGRRGNPINTPWRYNREMKREFVVKDEFYYMHLHNLIHAAQSRNSFKRLFIGARLAAGVQLQWQEDTAGKEFNETTKERLVAASKDIKTDRCIAIADSRDLTAAEADALEAEGDIKATEDKLALCKYKLGARYNVGPGDITADFVREYDDKRTRGMFAQLNMTVGKGSMKASIAAAVSECVEHLESKDTLNIHKIVKKRTPLKLRYAETVLDLMAGQINGREYTAARERVQAGDSITRGEFEERIGAAVSMLQCNYNTVALQFGIRRDRIIKARETERSKLDLINSVLRGAFDISFVGDTDGRVNKAAAKFVLRDHSKFDYTPEGYVCKKLRLERAGVNPDVGFEDANALDEL